MLSEVCREKGLVIATGGGAILRPENVRAMRQNGVVILLNRALESLPMEGRPLSRSLAALRAMWDERAPVYRAAADAAIDNDAAPEDAAKGAEEAFYETADR